MCTLRNFNGLGDQGRKTARRADVTVNTRQALTPGAFQGRENRDNRTRRLLQELSEMVNKGAYEYEAPAGLAFVGEVKIRALTFSEENEESLCMHVFL